VNLANEVSFKLLFLLSILTSLFFQFSHLSTQARYQSFSTFEPKISSACSLYNAKQEHLAGDTHYSISGIGSCDALVRAESDVLEFHYRLNSNSFDEQFFKVEHENGESLHLEKLNSKENDSWIRLRVEVPQGEFVKVGFVNSNDKASISIKRRINHFSFSDVFSGKYLSYFSTLLVSLCAAACLFYLQNNFSIFSFCLLLTPLLFSIFFRSELNFYYDDWTIQEKILNLGVSAIWQRHNEHWPIVSSALSYLESLFFGSSYSFYILISVFLNVLNGLMIVVLFSQLFKESSVRKPLGLSVATFYLFCSLHVENLQWDVCKQMLCTIFFILSSVFSSIEYLRSRKVMMLFLAFFSSFLACFSMATGFLVVFIVPSFCFIFSACFSKEKEYLSIFRAIFVCSFVFLSCGLAAFIYFGEPSIDSSLTLSNVFQASPRQFIGFLVFGSQYGSLVRGLFGSLPNMIENRIAYLCFGLFLNLFFLLFSVYVSKAKKEAFGFWLFGQLFLFLPLLLFAVGRAQLGANISLSPRYHSMSLIGVLFLLAPVLEVLLKNIVNNEMGLSYQSFVRARGLAFACCVAFFFLHVVSIDRFDRLVEAGENINDFYPKMKEWNRLIDREPYQPGPWFEGYGTGYEGLYPYFFEKNNSGVFFSKSPIVHPDIIQKILDQ